MSKYHIVRLGELISPANVIKCGTNIYPVLSMTMHDGIVLQSNRFKKSLASLDTSEYKVVKEGQLVVGFPIDEGVLYIQHHSFEGIMSPAYDVYNVDYSRITGVYLESALHSPQSMQYYASKLRGTTARRRSIPKKDLFELPIILPDLATQKHITDIISYANKLIEICKSILEKTDTLVKSRFVEMFGDPILNPKGWEMTTIGEIVTEVKYGTSRPAIDGGKYAYLRMNNLTYDGYLDLADLKRIDIPDSEIEKCIVRKGDVLFNRTNSIELVGKTCVFDKDEDMIIAGYIIRVRLKPVMLPLIMSYFMNTDALKKKLRSMAKGAVNQANINAQELKAIKIYLPPTDLQQQFADFVAQTDKSKYCLVGEQILGKAEMLIELLNQEYFG